jgi:hypothetical protein
MQVTAGNIYNHASLQAVGMTNLQGSYLQRIEISSIDIQDLSNKVNDPTRKLRFRRVFVSSMGCAKKRDL